MLQQKDSYDYQVSKTLPRIQTDLNNPGFLCFLFNKSLACLIITTASYHMDCKVIREPLRDLCPHSIVLTK